MTELVSNVCSENYSLNQIVDASSQRPVFFRIY